MRRAAGEVSGYQVRVFAQAVAAGFAADHPAVILRPFWGRSCCVRREALDLGAARARTETDDQIALVFNHSIDELMG